MTRLVFIGVYLLFSAVVAGESDVCSSVEDNPCRNFPLSLLDWYKDTNEADIDGSVPDDVKFLNSDGSLSVIGRLLLFPVCYFDESYCVEYGQGVDEKWSVIKVCQNSDETCLLEYTIETGWHALHGIIGSIRQANLVSPANCLHILYGIYSNTVSSLHFVLTFVKSSFITMAANVTGLNLPDCRVLGIMEVIQEVFRNITWAMIRYAVVGIIAVSLFPSTRQIRKYTMKAVGATKYLCGPSKEKNWCKPSLSTIENAAVNSGLIGATTVIGSLGPLSVGNVQMLKEHYPMCEYFDIQECNCGGRPDSKEPKMISIMTDKPFGSSSKKELEPVSRADVVADPEIIEDIKCHKDIHEPESVEILPEWVQMAVGGIHVSDTNVLIDNICKNDCDPETCPLKQLTEPKGSPCDVSTNESEIYEESVEEIPHTTTANLVNSSPKKVQFNIGIPLHNGDSLDIDSEEEPFIKNLNESDISDIGSPYLNSSFKEDSPYVTANSVPYEDLLDRGDGAIFSTLTRRSPYIEEGLGDLSTDISLKDSERSILDSSILDVSDLNSSISFNAGEGVIEVATLFALQTFWRIVKHAWQDENADRNINNVSIQEKESGLYVIRQKNKSKDYRSPIRTTYKRRAEILRELDDNNNNSTETLLYYEVTNTLRKGKLLQPSTLKGQNKHRTNEAFSKWNDCCHQSQNLSRETDSGAKLRQDASVNDEEHIDNPNFNNNARHSKRKRGHTKRRSDSGSKADCEECDCSDGGVQKRGRTVYKTRETLDKCHAKKHDQVINSDICPEINRDTHKSHVAKKNQVAKKGQGSSAHNRKKRRRRKHTSTQKRNIPSDVQETIDRLTRDLTNASMNDHIGNYVGDSSDDFADDSFSSSDEKSGMLCHSLHKKSTLTPSYTQICKEGLRVSSATSCGQNKTCSCRNCKRHQVNDIIHKRESQRRNIWELKEYTHISKDDVTSNILAWAWSCVEKL